MFGDGSGRSPYESKQSLTALAEPLLCRKYPGGGGGHIACSMSGGKECVACPAGQYQDLTGQTTCIDCTTPFTSFAGSAACDACVEGYYYDADDEKCITVRTPIPE